MKEIGGYFELEQLDGQEFYEKLLKLNSSRNSLRFLIQKKNIKKIYLPIFLCNVVYEACLKEQIEIIFYHIDNNFFPILEKTDEYVYIVNYYGFLSNTDLLKLKKKYFNLIVDNTHAFFQTPELDIDTIYNCRKYFGVPDGSYLSTDLEGNLELEEQSVKDMLGHLIGRMEENANLYYNEFSSNDNKFGAMDIQKMSKFTSNIMKGIHYDNVFLKRKNNYNYLYDSLQNIQIMKIPKNGTFMYPLMVSNHPENLRKHLIEHNIYIPRLWSNIPSNEELNESEKNFQNILPIPIDQRYNEFDMQYISNLIFDYIKEMEVK